MSNHRLLLIPADPDFVPGAEAAEQARAFLAGQVPEAEDVAAFFTDRVEFFSPAGNWSGVECPYCRIDIEPWWAEAMDAAYATGFADLSAVTACCGMQVSLNRLHYVWPAGFARFGIEATNPRIHDLEPAHQQRIAELLGSAVTRIWVHA